jgi:hypothetical protein
MHEALVLPGQTAEKNGGVIALQLGEGELDRAVEVVNFLLDDAGFLFEPLALGLKALPEQILGRQDVKQFAVVLRGLDWCDSAHLRGSHLYFELSRNFESVKMSNAIENKVKHQAEPSVDPASCRQYWLTLLCHLRTERSERQ